MLGAFAPTQHPFPSCRRRNAFDGEDISSDDSSEETEMTKDVSPAGASRSGITANGNAPSSKDYDSDSFTEVTRKKRIASIVIDAGKNATGLLEQLGKHVGAPLEGRFENGKLRVFPKSIVEHRKLQAYISDNMMRSHTFEMSHTQQLKCVIRGLPTDFDHTELMQELRGFGFDPNHISLLKNKKTNTNMPLFLVTLPKNPDNQGIFNITNIGFFRVHAEPLNKSNMPPQCYRCQEFYHHSRFCNRAPRCLKCSGGHLTSDCKKPNKAPAKYEFKDTIIDYNPDVIGIQETHLRPADRVSIPNYTCHRSDRTTHRGGGTAIFVKNSIRHHAIVNTSNTFENTSVILHVGNNTKITVACIYRPPHGSINTIELDAILNHSNKAFLFGDFNAKHSSWNPGRSNTNGNILCNWAVGSALDIIAPDTPTHFNAWHTNNILDIGFAANLAHTDVFTINALSSDHNPVIFDFITNNILPPILRTLKSTNWIKFQEILYHNVPGNPQIDNLDTAVQNFTDVITNAISASTSTRVINTPHLRLPENIRELIRAKNRFRKLWNNTRYQPYKREVNALIRQIRKEIEAHKNRTWKDLLLTLNPQDNSLYNLHRKITKKEQRSFPSPWSRRNGLF
ncbi:probable RNA-directed DNA polymerase from transposon X-element [Trichonephila clavipes]|nr:probable RNA-directed DNA polymerase from transposon X-element [Trichonephila clavipes]